MSVAGAVRNGLSFLVQCGGTVFLGGWLAQTLSEMAPISLDPAEEYRVLPTLLLGVGGLTVGNLLGGVLGRLVQTSRGFGPTHVATAVLAPYGLFQLLGEWGHPHRFYWGLAALAASVGGLYLGSLLARDRTVAEDR